MIKEYEKKKYCVLVRVEYRVIWCVQGLEYIDGCSVR